MADEMTTEPGYSKDPGNQQAISKMTAQGGTTSTKPLGCKQTHCVKRKMREADREPEEDI